MASSRQFRTLARRMKREAAFRELWFATRLQDAGIPFKREVTVGFYIIDFILPDQLLAVEIGRSMHNERYDKRRDEFLQKSGFSVLRVQNSERGSIPMEDSKSVAGVDISAFKSALARASRFCGHELRKRICSICVSFSLLLSTGCNSEALSKIEKRQEELSAKVESVSRNAEFDLREKCLNAGHRWVAGRPGRGFGVAHNIVAHYNIKLNRCYVQWYVTTLEANSGGNSFVDIQITDALEGAQVALLMWSTRINKEFLRGSPRRCEVTTPDRELKKCSSYEEFEKLTATYMKD